MVQVQLKQVMGLRVPENKVVFESYVIKVVIIKLDSDSFQLKHTCHGVVNIYSFGTFEEAYNKYEILLKYV